MLKFRLVAGLKIPRQAGQSKPLRGKPSPSVRARRGLARKRERYRELIENANDIVYMLDFEGRITINKAAGNDAGLLAAGAAE